MGDVELRKLPAVHQLAQDPALTDVVLALGREAVVEASRRVVDEARADLRSGGAAPARDALVGEVRRLLASRPTCYQTVINATGVVLHTNLGRAPLPEAAWQAMREARDYCDLEMELATGKRASRQRGVEAALLALCHAEAGMVVNNNAAAVLLGLAGLAGTRPTAISRGHLVEIGGGFRLPTIMEASGSPLLEVGTTNRTHLEDYAIAIEQGAALILFVHRSNFVMSGYVSEPPIEAVLALAAANNVPVMLDLGSGALFDTAAYGLPEELTVPRAVALGFDVVTFSGDKLMGGPQAGWLVGRGSAIDALRRHPLARAVRCDKLQLAAGVATLELYRRGEAMKQVPVWTMIATTKAVLRERAEAWRVAVGRGDVVDADDAVGGGSLPEGKLAGCALRLSVPEPDIFMTALRQGAPPVVGHIEADHVLLHPRTVHPSQDAQLIAALRAALAG
jgi:L-seryl-tRNA(Ser) seleniumtransferase